MMVVDRDLFVARGGARGGGRGGLGKRGGAGSVTLEPHKHEGVFIAKGKVSDRLNTLNPRVGC